MKAVFLDRDGVLTQVVLNSGKPLPPASLKDVVIPADVAAGLKRLKQAGFLLIVVTNQPDVARHQTSLDVVTQINQYLRESLPLDDIFVCYHDDAHLCLCRKPKPGLLLEAAKRYQIDLSKSFMIGDRWKDIEAGQQAGCKTIWMKSAYHEPMPLTANHTASSFADATQWIIEQL